MTKQSAGVLLYRVRESGPEVLLVHPGGPFWAKKDAAGWSFPKGEIADEEDLLTAGQREFAEETGHRLTGPFQPLGSLKQSGGKVVHAWATEGDYDPAALASNTFEMEWPPNSGKRALFPEVDRAAWFPLDTAVVKLHKGLIDFIPRLRALLGPV